MADLRPQSEGFSFYRIPKQLVKGREYRPLSPAGKLLAELEQVGLIEQKSKARASRIGSMSCIFSPNQTSSLPLFRSLEVKNFYIKKPKSNALI